MSSFANRPRSAARLLAFAVVILIASVSTSASFAAAAQSKKTAVVSVMTRNLYLGADLSPALDATDLCGAIDGAGEILNEVDRTNFPARAVALGDEILAANPALVGLQEVALWRNQADSDYTTTPATEVSYDFLKLLLDNLDHKYRVAVVQNEFDEELPADTDGSDATEDSSGSLGGLGCGIDMDGRLTMRDVILVRKGGRVTVSDPRSGQFQHQAVFTVGGAVSVPVERGWVSVRASVDQGPNYRPNRFRFVSTHLEAFDDGSLRAAQARELLKPGGPAARSEKTVLLGDFNSGNVIDGVFGNDRLAHQAIVAAGFQNLGVRDSCCYPSALNDPGFLFDHTVDHVYARPTARLLDGRITGNDASKMVPSGAESLWPSDHGGVVERIRLRR